jgi:L-asparaginase II
MSARAKSTRRVNVMNPPADPVPLVEVVRSGLVECVHRGHVVILGPDGSVQDARGETEAPMFPRSCNKPLQAVGLLRAGFRGSPEQLAVAAASHSGEPVHVTVSRSILADAGVDEDELRCPPDLPLDETARRAVLASGGGPQRIFMNCSGKHAAMLSTCATRGWPLDGYLDPAHPVQLELARAVAELAGQSVDAVGVDGCGAPIYALSLTGLARAFLRLADAADGREHEVAAAMRAHPWLVAGTGRAATRLMAGLPGLVAKDGAEGVWAAAVPGVGAVAVKIEDGAMRAADRVVVAALRGRLGSLAAAAPVLDELAVEPLFGGGHQVGEIRIIAGAV